MNILIIDDEKLDLFIAKKQLNLVYENVTGFSAMDDSCRQWIKENDFDVVLLDYYLEGTTGLEVLKEICLIKERNFKAFALTNYVDQKDVLALTSAGFNAVIFKPLTAEALKSHL